MKITEPIDERLWQAINKIANFTESRLEALTDADYKYADGLAEAVELVSEYASCFGADGSVELEVLYRYNDAGWLIEKA